MTDTCALRTRWGTDAWGRNDALYFGKLYVGQVLRWNDDRWRAWIMLTDDENDAGCHIGWCQSCEEAKAVLQARAEEVVAEAIAEGAS